ncbi:hypothetical protein HDU84_001231, partial [Entophlyctis sp. JEL0112]
ASPNCKLEFNYAAALQKPIVPVYSDTKPLLTDSVHMVTLPLVQARLASIFSSCQASLDFRSHADWDSQMAILKAEIIAKLNSSSHGDYLSSSAQTAPVQFDTAETPAIDLPAAVPSTFLASVSPAARDPAGSDVPVPASISNDFYLKYELEDWLSPVSFESDMASYASQYVEGTRDWAVDAIGKQFTGDANVVWLNGAAGVGKSL